MKKTRNEYKSEPQELAVGHIVNSAWNTHREAKKDSADFLGLVESLRANGMLHRVVVREIPGGKYEIIDGHRRFEAAKSLGWRFIPCEVIVGIDEAEARGMMLTANVQRLENDPLLEAERISELMGIGKTFGEIAAIMGKDERYVARRARLTNLTEKWVKLFSRIDNITAADMEKVAGYERKLQDEVFDYLELGDLDDDDTVDLNNVAWHFEQALQKIDADTAFDTAECANCPYNTACHQLLFPELAEKARCQNSECYVRKWNMAVDAKIDALRHKNVTVKQVTNKWNVPNSYNSTPEKSRKNTHPYVYMDGKLKRLVWSVANVSRSSTPAKTEAEKAEEKRVRKEHLAWSRNRHSAYDKIRSTFNDEAALRKMLLAEVSTERFRDWAYNYFVKKFGTYIYDNDCRDLFNMVGKDTLKAYSCDVTEDEVAALSSEDPAKTNN